MSITANNYNIKGITFDLWNTIFQNRFYLDERVNFLQKFLEVRGYDLSFKTLKEAYNNSMFLSLAQLNSHHKRFNHIYIERRIDNLLQEINLKLDDSVIKKIKDGFELILLDDIPPLKKGAKEVLEIVSSNYKIGLISDTGITPGRILKKALDKHNILKFFDVLTFSDEIGKFKPHQKPFKVTLELLKIEPEKAIHVGDLLATDIKGANKYNMKSIWISENNQKSVERVKPDYIIRELNEIPSILKKINKTKI
jgi:putative hydrolase of the HAD superfamily